MLIRSVDLNYLPSVDPETVLQTGKMGKKCVNISDRHNSSNQSYVDWFRK